MTTTDDRFDDSTLRVDGSGTHFWHDQEGRLHRTDGPAIEWTNGDREWWVRARLHRIDGPAVERADGRCGWWINGREITDEGQFLVEASTVRVLDRPLSAHEIEAMWMACGDVRGRVPIRLSELLEGDVGSVAAVLSERLTGSRDLIDVSIRPVGTTDDGRVVVDVRGDPAALIAHR